MRLALLVISMMLVSSAQAIPLESALQDLQLEDGGNASGSRSRLAIRIDTRRLRLVPGCENSLIQYKGFCSSNNYFSFGVSQSYMRPKSKTLEILHQQSVITG